MPDDNNNNDANTSGNTDNSSGSSDESLKDITIADLVKKNPAVQDELNTMMADNRRTLTKQNQELITQLETLKKNTRLTQEERDELQSRITQLEEQYLSKEELIKRETNKKEKEYNQEIENLSGDRDSWKNMYTTETIDRALQDAAISGEALHPTQIVDLFRGKTQLTEVLDENGQPTGGLAPIIKFNDVNEDGKPVVLDLSPTDLIKRIKELPDKYGNLFKGQNNSGLGESGSAGGNTQPALNDILKDPVKYAKWRKDNPDLDVSKLRR